MWGLNRHDHQLDRGFGFVLECGNGPSVLGISDGLVNWFVLEDWGM